jgi:hypothetical protein
MPRSLLALALLLAAPPALAQPDVSLGADLVSRYVWRGLDFGQSAAAQPYIELSAGGLTVGTWGSFAISGAGANELDLYASYSFGPLSVGVTDYYFPSVAPAVGGDVDGGADFFNYGDGGAHVIEPFVSYDGPVSLTLATNAFNDDDVSTYLEAGYGLAVGGVDLGLAVGAVFALDSSDGVAGSSYYLTNNDAAITNVMLSAAKEIPITDQFALPVFGQYVVNPETERAFLLFGLSL